MSFVMIAVGATRASRVRTVSIRSLMIAGVLTASGLLAAGTGLGLWISQPTPVVQPDSAPSPATLPFAIEQMGALSARLFKLESQAVQLGQRVGVMLGAEPKAQPAARESRADKGGPMLPPRPDRDAHDVLGALQSRLHLVEQEIALVSDAATLRSLSLRRLPTRLPIADAELVSSYGNRDDPLTGRRAFHGGLDFAAAPGAAIHAAAGGRVEYAGFKPDFGWVVEIEHGNGLSTRYAHASKLLVKQGQLVTPGDPIAAVGSSGRATGPHLHFEVLRHGEVTDPRRYLAGL